MTATQTFLGATVRDRITGFEGVAVARCQYLNGRITYAVQAKPLVKGEPHKWHWFDAEQLDVVGPAEEWATGTQAA